VVAVGRSILEIAYHLFNRATTHQELGAHYFDAQHSERLKRHSLARLQRLGYRVTLVLARA
jgi:transposase